MKKKKYFLVKSMYVHILRFQIQFENKVGTKLDIETHYFVLPFFITYFDFFKLGE